MSMQTIETNVLDMLDRLRVQRKKFYSLPFAQAVASMY